MSTANKNPIPRKDTLFSYAEPEKLGELLGTLPAVLWYGPYEVAGIVKHRTERLAGVRDQLNKYGIVVKLRKWELYDRCSIFIDGMSLFSCRLTLLQYPFMEDKTRDLMCNTVRNVIASYWKRMSGNKKHSDVKKKYREVEDESERVVYRGSTAYF